MRPLIAFLLLLLFLSAHSALGELWKLPALVHHYHTHHQASGGQSQAGTGFWAFLQLHYADAEHQQAHQKEHQQLPFKQLVESFAYVAFLPSAAVVADAVQVIHLQQPNHRLQNHASHFPGNQSAIWQPPRGIV